MSRSTSRATALAMWCSEAPAAVATVRRVTRRSFASPEASSIIVRRPRSVNRVSCIRLTVVNMRCEYVFCGCALKHHLTCGFYTCGYWVPDGEIGCDHDFPRRRTPLLQAAAVRYR